MKHLEILFKPVTVPAFDAADGYWTNYSAVREDGITAITVVPELKTFRIGLDLYCEINCRFDEAAFPESRYGLVYGDNSFEQNIDAHLKSIMAFLGDDARIVYTEQGMQDDGLISMEMNRVGREALASASNHALLSLMRHPEIDTLSVDDVTWSATDPVS